MTVAQQIINRDAGEPALLVRQTTGAPAALTVQQTSATGGSAVNVVSDSTSQPAVAIRGAGDLLRLRDSAGAEVFRVDQYGGAFGGANSALPSGYYVYPSSPGAVSTSVTLGVGALRLVPWLVRQRVSLTRIGAEITTVGEAGSKLRLGIYADTGSSTPGALVVDGGVIAGDSATVQELTIDTTLTPGLYWIGGAVQVVVTTQPTVRTVSNWTPPIVLHSGTSIPSANGTVVGWSLASITGALPATFTVGGSSGAAGSAPRVFVKTA